jgi:hypothetical protein
MDLLRSAALGPKIDISGRVLQISFDPMGKKRRRDSAGGVFGGGKTEVKFGTIKASADDFAKFAKISRHALLLLIRSPRFRSTQNRRIAGKQPVLV